MSCVRQQDRLAQARPLAAPEGSVFLIEDSMALTMLLKERIESATSSPVHWCKSYSEAHDALKSRRPLLAITGLDLPDAPRGEILELLEDHDVPTILFTTIVDEKIRQRVSRPNILEYLVKGQSESIERILNLIGQASQVGSIPILVVDDTDSARATLTAALRGQNCRVYEASSAKAALEILAEHDEIELVITDYHMPDMDGEHLTRRIRSLRSADRVRVIGISSSTDRSLSAAFLKAGASDFIYRPFIDEEVRCRVASNIETLQQIKRLRYLAERDLLTGLFNRRAFFEHAYEALERSHEEGTKGWIGILDIDHFKQVNDTYGHDAGDKVLKEVARIVTDIAGREKFLAARFGGEEFAFLFLDCDHKKVFSLCEKIRTSISDLRISYERHQLHVTASMGLAGLQRDEGLDNNLNAADQMLYMAKAGGRNQVVSDAVLYGLVDK